MILDEKEKKKNREESNPRFFLRSIEAENSTRGAILRNDAGSSGEMGGGRGIGRQIRKNRLGTLYLSRGGTCRRGAQRALLLHHEGGEVIKRRNCHVAELMSTRGGRRRIY